MDKNVVRGVSYHYCLTAIDDGSQNKDGIFPGQPLESSYYNNRTIKAAIPFKPPAETTENLVIVPNPYSVSPVLPMQ